MFFIGYHLAKVRFAFFGRSMRQLRYLLGFWEVGTDAYNETGDFFNVEFRFDDFGLVDKHGKARSRVRRGGNEQYIPFI